MSETDLSSAVRTLLAEVSNPVRLVFFEQSFGCESCPPTRQLLEQLPDLSPHITLEVLNLILEKDRAAQYGIDRVPATIVESPGLARIRFYGPPVGHEIVSLFAAIRRTASGVSGLSEASRARLAALDKPVEIKVFFTPTCVYCPQMVTLAGQIAVESPYVTATAIDATEYPDLVRVYGVTGVPKTVINDAIEIIGASTEEELVDQVLAC